jgi:hypothetical protein
MSVISRSLELPDGYQRFEWDYDPSVSVSDPGALERDLNSVPRTSTLQLYTQHQIFLEDGVIKHTRSSPNWEGGLVTFATCKHLMRSYARADWRGTWLVGLCPRHLASNAVLFVGRIDEAFDSNYDLSRRVLSYGGGVFTTKNALLNPRGDLYTPHRELTGDEVYDRSPGTDQEFVPKWWRDLEYKIHGRRPRVFILRPCHIFSRPMVWTSIIPGRATRRLTVGEFIVSMRRTQA